VTTIEHQLAVETSLADEPGSLSAKRGSGLAFDERGGPQPHARSRLAAFSGFRVRVNIIEFSRLLAHALATLVVIDSDRRLYVDHPAEFKGPGDDLWRADDGGEIMRRASKWWFLLKRGATYTIAIRWMGPRLEVLAPKHKRYKLRFTVARET